MPPAIEHDGDGSAGRVTVEAQHMHQFIARRRGMARFAGREFRPTVQQAVAIDEYAHERHGGN